MPPEIPKFPGSDPDKDPIVREGRRLINEIRLDLAEANKEARSARVMMDEAQKNNDPEAIANWTRIYEERKARADMLSGKFKEKIDEIDKLEDYVKSEMDSEAEGE